MISEERLKEIAKAQPVQEYDSAYTTLGDIKELAQELLSTRKTLTQLKELMGYVQNGSDTTVSLFQDDATMDYMLRVGKKTYWGHSLENVIAKAFEAEGARK
jgi:hypothetical protein